MNTSIFHVDVSEDEMADFFKVLKTITKPYRESRVEVRMRYLHYINDTLIWRVYFCGEERNLEILLEALRQSSFEILYN